MSSSSSSRLHPLTDCLKGPSRANWKGNYAMVFSDILPTQSEGGKVSSHSTERPLHPCLTCLEGVRRLLHSCLLPTPPASCSSQRHIGSTRSPLSPSTRLSASPSPTFTFLASRSYTSTRSSAGACGCAWSSFVIVWIVVVICSHMTACLLV